jgi:phosphoribosyl 1,2-cyclic phosphodiesterase
MYIKFWGTRGSIPMSLSLEELRKKISQALLGAAGLDLTDPTVLKRYVERLPWTIQSTAGGNTPCLEVRSDNQLLILDAGSGIRTLGLELLEKEFGQGQGRADLLISHTHWDHIQGFPFFRPAFVPGNVFTFHTPLPDLYNRLVRQQEDLFFPVPVSYMSAALKFEPIKANEWHQIGNFRIYPIPVSHPGDNFAYRIEDGRSSLVYATDAEYKRVDRASTERYIELFRDADMMVFDAQYTLTEVLDKADWGHSSALMGAEFAHRAGVKRLALFHHDPTSSDEKIWAAKEQAEGYLLRHPASGVCEVLVAYDGLSVEI